MGVNYGGGHPFAGKSGQCFGILPLGAALFALIGYFFATREPEVKPWQTLGRAGLRTNVVPVVAIGSILCYLIYHHYFAYHYVWAHSSTSLPTHFIISSFWEGQEGSFWLWMFWQVVLGVVLVCKAKSWEAPVMTFVMLCQVF